MKTVSLLIAAVGLETAGAANVKLDAMKHDIHGITAGNFDGVISKFRDIAVASCWFYKEDSKADANLLDEYNQAAATLKGMAKITALSCSEFPVFCKKAGVTETPHVMVYPTNPMPPFKYEGKLEAKAISAKVSKFITDLSLKLSSDNVDVFATTEPTKPKVMLFSDKKRCADYLESFVERNSFQANNQIWLRQCGREGHRSTFQGQEISSSNHATWCESGDKRRIPGRDELWSIERMDQSSLRIWHGRQGRWRWWRQGRRIARRSETVARRRSPRADFEIAAGYLFQGGGFVRHLSEGWQAVSS